MKVFLGGTCNESTWRDSIIPMLDTDYFNPVVDNWTEDCMKQEIEERQNSDICLYTITPRMIGVYAIAEAIDDSNKRPEKTILVLLRSDKELQFNESQWRSLGAVTRMVQANGGQVFDKLKSAADYINNLKPIAKHMDVLTAQQITDLVANKIKNIIKRYDVETHIDYENDWVVHKWNNFRDEGNSIIELS